MCSARRRIPRRKSLATAWTHKEVLNIWQTFQPWICKDSRYSVIIVEMKLTGREFFEMEEYQIRIFLGNQFHLAYRLSAISATNKTNAWSIPELTIPPKKRDAMICALVVPYLSMSQKIYRKYFLSKETKWFHFYLQAAVAWACMSSSSLLPCFWWHSSKLMIQLILLYSWLSQSKTILEETAVRISEAYPQT